MVHDYEKADYLYDISAFFLFNTYVENFIRKAPHFLLVNPL